MRITTILLFCMACSAAPAPQSTTTTAQESAASSTAAQELAASPASIPASSSCAYFDPAGVWTLRSDIHRPQDFSLRRDNIVALDDGVLRWHWEDSESALEGCIVRFETDFNGEHCEYVVVESGAAVNGFVRCCETGEPGVEVERVICEELPVSGVVRLSDLGSSTH